MKKSFFFLMTLALVAVSCKKSTDGASNTLMIAEVYKNGHLDGEYLYATDKRLIRYNEYGVFLNQSTLSLYVLYEHDQDGLIIKRKVFTTNDTLNNYYVLSYDNADRLSRMDWYAFGQLYEYRLYEYDQQNQIIKYTIRNGGTDATKNYSDFVYDEQGRLKNQKYYAWNVNKFYLNYEYDYTPAGKNVYKHWQKYMTYPGDLLVPELVAESRHVVFYDKDGNLTTDYTETGTNRQYNSSGYLVKQTITKDYTKPANADEVRNMEYQYTQ